MIIHQSKLERSKRITKFGLNDILVIRKWLAYAQEVGDQSVNQITNENFGKLNIVKLIKKRRSLKINNNSSQR